MIMNTKRKKIKIEPRIKLNYNIYTCLKIDIDNNDEALSLEKNFGKGKRNTTFERHTEVLANFVGVFP